MSKKIRFSVVGCGHIGKRHAQMILENSQAELVGICDIRSKSELGIVDKFDVPFFTNYLEMLDKIETDLVCVCTPNGLHYHHTKEALKKKLHVVCEKPLGLLKQNCEELLDLSLKMSKHIFCVMQNRYSPPSVWLKEVIESNKLGNIYMVQINCFWNRDERYYKSGTWKGKKDLDGGTLFTQFSHFIDLMYWLFGDIKNILGLFKDFNHSKLTEFEDSGVVHFEFADKNVGIGSINYSTSVVDTNLESSMTIIAEKGSIKVGGQYMDKVEYCNIKNYKMPELSPSNPPNDYGHYKGSAANHHFIIQNAIEVLTEYKTATTNALEGLKVVDIIERIYEKRDKQFSK